MNVNLKQQLILLTTVSTSQRLASLDRLIDSIASSERPIDLVICHRILLQNGLNYRPCVEQDHYQILLDHAAGALSLSVARNQLLRSAGLEQNQGAILAFPDDDAWYPDGLILYLISKFVRSPQLDMWICQYGSQPLKPVPGLSASANFTEMLRHASSNTIFLRAPLATRIGAFSETLGVGTAVPGGEDTEYALRAFAQARSVELMPLPCVGHRDADPTIRGRYYIGGLAALASNLRNIAPCRRALLRKLLVGIFYMICGRLTPRALLKAWLHAARIFKNGREAAPNFK